jgi:gas vesicle protein
VSETATVNQAKLSTGSIAILSFIGGAVLGAVVVALTTPRTGPQVREDLKALGRRAKDKVGEMGDQFGEAWTESSEHAGQSVADLKRGVHEAAEDLKRGLHEASEDLRRGVREAAAEFRTSDAPKAGVNNGARLT